MNTQPEAMKLALKKIADALPAYIGGVASREYLATIHEALAEQQAQPQQEPVAYWIPKAEQFCIADPSGRPFAKAWEPLHASPPQRTWVGLTADDLKEPKNGEQWRVEWWNESCRMMLPADMKLDRSVVWKNGTVQFTIKKSAHGIKENT